MGVRAPVQRSEYCTVSGVQLCLSKPQMTCICFKETTLQLKYCWGMPVVVKGHFLADKRQKASSCVRVRFIIPKLFFCLLNQCTFIAKSLNKAVLNHWRVYFVEEGRRLCLCMSQNGSWVVKSQFLPGLIPHSCTEESRCSNSAGKASPWDHFSEMKMTS